MENVSFPKILAEVAILQAKHDALEGLFLNFVKEVRPELFQNFSMAYENMYKKKAFQNIYSIPQVDADLREDLKRQLGL